MWFLNEPNTYNVYFTHLLTLFIYFYNSVIKFHWYESTYLNRNLTPTVITILRCSCKIPTQFVFILGCEKRQKSISIFAKCHCETKYLFWDSMSKTNYFGSRRDLDVYYTIVVTMWYFNISFYLLLETSIQCKSASYLWLFFSNKTDTISQQSNKLM